MNQFANAFGSKFVENKDLLRIRSFELGGHTFKVKVPLTAEIEAMYERLKVVDETTVEKYYQEISKDFQDQEKHSNDPDVKYIDGDILIKDKSLKETAKNKLITENRITEFVRLLVPENKEFDMSEVKYSDIEELFPFAIQLELIEQIGNCISPNYQATKGK